MTSRLVIIPTYNELENIEAITRAVMDLTPPFDLLIVDDNSPDGTASRVKLIQQEFSDRIFLLERTGKSGLGTAYLEGFRWALDRHYEYILEMDADFSHPVDKLVELYKTCANGSVDLAVGSRYVDGGGLNNWPFIRLALSKSASYYVQCITGMPIKDPTAGFVCYKRAVLDAMDLTKIKFVGYAFQIEMKYAAYKLGFRLKEIPIIFSDRIMGKSKMNILIIREALVGVIYMRFFRKASSYKK